MIGSVKGVTGPESPTSITEKITLTITYDKETKIADGKPVQILYQNDIIAGKNPLELEVTRWEWSDQEDGLKISIDFSFETLADKDELFLKRCQENIGRIVIKTKLQDGNIISYSAVVMIHKDEKEKLCATILRV